MHRRQLLTRFSLALTAGALGHPLLARARQATPPAETREITHAGGVTVVPANPERLLALGEEFLLADLLELGIKPAASSANFPDAYIGIDPAKTEGLEPFSIWDADLEAIIALQPDLILVPESYVQIAPDIFTLIGQIAPLVVLPDTDVWQDDFRFLASVFGLEELADQKIAELDAAIAEAAAELALEGQTATFATVYPGGTDITLWLTDRLMIVEVAIALGLSILPDATDFDTDHLGRAHISLEQARLITGDTLIMLQTTGGISPEEEASFAEVNESPIWAAVPAVQNERVFVIERIGYPGDVTGRRRLLETYREIFG